MRLIDIKPKAEQIEVVKESSIWDLEGADGHVVYSKDLKGMPGFMNAAGVKELNNLDGKAADDEDIDSGLLKKFTQKYKGQAFLFLTHGSTEMDSGLDVSVVFVGKVNSGYAEKWLKKYIPIMLKKFRDDEASKTIGQVNVKSSTDQIPRDDSVWGYDGAKENVSGFDAKVFWEE